ncbi:hypothetical protein JD844_001722 [Phrynosoma platyrhinos]|uniref:Protein kinase domain-containing protein n=1 Tax=Phrynosoma platyrhinos TaxID=52577 RepID=A0ABQ7TAE6_PHRPL|nr:hypothetical protein JD844_001722 [Phrynosoma platyrhinos]
MTPSLVLPLFKLQLHRVCGTGEEAERHALTSNAWQIPQLHSTQSHQTASRSKKEQLGTSEVLQQSRGWCLLLAMDLTLGMEAQALLEDMLEITAQSLVHMEVSEHYQIIKELGKGKYGQVVLVTHRKRGKATLQVSGPEIVKTHDLLLSEQAGIPEPAAKLCAKQLVSALDFIHSRGLVYRDVKPENILLFDRHCRCIKLTDFGLTRPQGTLLHLVAGIIPYTAPELSRGTSDTPGLPIDASLDAWALGVLIFCLLTGYFPWEKTVLEDSFFEDFVIWQESGSDEDLPYHWRPLSQDAIAMLQNLLALEPTKRGPIRRVLSYLDRPWRAETTPKDPLVMVQ